jgi:general secretion pathway protein K
LLTVALATLMVSGLFLREHVTVRSVENRLALTQTRWVERAAVDWSKVILAADLRTGEFDHLGEPWAVPVEETRLDETVTAGARIDDDTRAATLSGSMQDAQGRLNLNNLITTLGEEAAGSPTVDAAQREIFENLLDLLGLPTSLATTLAARLLAAAPAPPNPTAIDQEPAFEVALPLLRIGDLQTVRGFDAEIIETLEPFVTLLPARTLINVNTAEPEVLAAAVEVLDIGSARQLANTREKKPFRTISEFIAAINPPPEAGQVKQDLLDIKTDYFLVKGLIRFGRVESFSETLLERQDRRVNVIWQRRL